MSYIRLSLGICQPAEPVCGTRTRNPWGRVPGRRTIDQKPWSIVVFECLEFSMVGDRHEKSPAGGRPRDFRRAAKIATRGTRGARTARCRMRASASSRYWLAVCVRTSSAFGWSGEPAVSMTRAQWAEEHTAAWEFVKRGREDFFPQELRRDLHPHEVSRVLSESEPVSDT